MDWLTAYLNLLYVVPMLLICGASFALGDGKVKRFAATIFGVWGIGTAYVLLTVFSPLPDSYLPYALFFCVNAMAFEIIRARPSGSVGSLLCGSYIALMMLDAVYGYLHLIGQATAGHAGIYYAWMLYIGGAQLAVLFYEGITNGGRRFISSGLRTGSLSLDRAPR